MFKESYKVIAAGYQHPELEPVEFIKIHKKRPMWWKLISMIRVVLHKYETYYWSTPIIQETLNNLQSIKFDAIIANDMKALPVAVKLAEEKKVPLLADIHEYKPRHYDHLWYFRVFEKPFWMHIGKKYLPMATKRTTVCEGLANEFFKDFQQPFDVITNAPDYYNLSPSEVDSTSIRIIHHGSLHSPRPIDDMIYLMDNLDSRFSLDLMMLENDINEYNRIVRLTKSRKNIRLIEPVPMLEIPEKINDYDIGLFMLRPNSFSYRMALPNKLFEFVQGRLMTAIWPSPEMKKVVDEYNLGAVSNNFSIESMAIVLNNLTADQIMEYKQNAHKSAKILSYDSNREKMITWLEELLKL